MLMVFSMMQIRGCGLLQCSEVSEAK